MEYLSDKIGDSFTRWVRGSFHFIATPTGSGKTTFVVKKLLAHAKNNNMNILYLVNRKILKQQLSERIKQEWLWGENENIIRVETYQSLENKIKNEFYNARIQPLIFHNSDSKLPVFFENRVNGFPLPLQELMAFIGKGFNDKIYNYIICDECHYFYQDSSYNTNTVLSYKWVLAEILFQSSIGIFMSATMEMVKEKILKDSDEIKKLLNQCHIMAQKGQFTYSNYYGAISGNNVFRYLERTNRKVDYDDICGIPDYSYLLLNSFEKMEDIPSLIEIDKNKKWIIFINDIKMGKKVCNEIKDQGINSVVLIHSGYGQDEEAENEVNEIVTKNQMNSQVIITTSVMDNGISIEDIELRNMIILADTKEDFIQMLGRKRFNENGEKVNVYICKQSEEYFKKRKQCNDRIEEFINKNLNKISAAALIDKVMSDKRLYGFASQTLYTMNGALAWNEWSVYKINSLDEYFKRLIRRFDEEGDVAFLNEQAEWLGIPVNQINMEFIEEKEDKLRESVNAVLREYCDKELNRDEYSKLVIKIRDDLKKLMSMKKNERQEVETIVKELKKNDRCISANNFAKISALAELDYNMIKKGRSVYCIIHK